MRQKLNEAGRTMLEMMAVLAIMGLIMYGAVVGVGFGVEMYKVTATYNDLEEISQTVSDLYSWAGKFPTGAIGNIGEVLCNKNLAPLECTARPIAHWANVKVHVTGYNDYFTIQLQGLTKTACGRLAKMDYQNMCVHTDTDGANGCAKGNLFLVSAGGSDLCAPPDDN